MRGGKVKSVAFFFSDMQSSYKAMYSSFHTNYFEKFMVINFTPSSHNWKPVVCVTEGFRRAVSGSP